MLSDYQTRVIESAIATLRQYLPALRESLDHLATTIREGRATFDQGVMAVACLQKMQSGPFNGA